VKTCRSSHRLHRAALEEVPPPGEVEEVEEHEERAGVAEAVAEEPGRPQELVVGVIHALVERQVVEVEPAPRQRARDAQEDGRETDRAEVTAQHFIQSNQANSSVERSTER
jgi:hypothetical protein